MCGGWGVHGGWGRLRGIEREKAVGGGEGCGVQRWNSIEVEGTWEGCRGWKAAGYSGRLVKKQRGLEKAVVGRRLWGIAAGFYRSRGDLRRLSWEENRGV